MRFTIYAFRVAEFAVGRKELSKFLLVFFFFVAIFRIDIVFVGW